MPAAIRSSKAGVGSALHRIKCRCAAHSGRDRTLRFALWATNLAFRREKGFGFDHVAII
jgi:hypothetical protein